MAFLRGCLVLKNIPRKQSLGCSRKKKKLPKGLLLLSFLLIPFLLLRLCMENPGTELQNGVSLFILRILARTHPHNLRPHGVLHVVVGAYLHHSRTSSGQLQDNPFPSCQKQKQHMAGRTGILGTRWAGRSSVPLVPLCLFLFIVLDSCSKHISSLLST